MDILSFKNRFLVHLFSLLFSFHLLHQKNTICIPRRAGRLNDLQETICWKFSFLAETSLPVSYRFFFQITTLLAPLLLYFMGDFTAGLGSKYQFSWHLTPYSTHGLTGWRFSNVTWLDVLLLAKVKAYSISADLSITVQKVWTPCLNSRLVFPD